LVALFKPLWQQVEDTDVVVATDPGVFKTNVDALCAVTRDEDHSTSNAVLHTASPQEAPTSAEQTRAADAGVIAADSRIHNDGNALEAHPASNLTRSLKGLADGESTSFQMPTQNIQAGSIELQTTSAPASPYVPPNTQLNTRDEINAASPVSSEVAASLISDIIEALGSNQCDGIGIAALTSPTTMPAELESIWSEDTSEIAPNARKLHNALSPPKMVRLTFK
jgi:hypothetical protein